MFWSRMYREMHFCWRNLLAVVFHFHLSTLCVFLMALRNKAGIAGISEPAVPLKSFSLLSLSTLSILIKPVYASWSQKSLMETFQFSSFIIRIDKTTLSLSQDSKSPCHYPGSICVSSPLHPHLVRAMRAMHNAAAGAALRTWLHGSVCAEISQVHTLAWSEQPWESIRQLVGLSLEQALISWN